MRIAHRTAFKELGKLNNSPSPSSFSHSPSNSSTIGLKIFRCRLISFTASFSSRFANRVYPAMSVKTIAANFRDGPSPFEPSFAASCPLKSLTSGSGTGCRSAPKLGSSGSVAPSFCISFCSCSYCFCNSFARSDNSCSSSSIPDTDVRFASRRARSHSRNHSVSRKFVMYKKLIQ